MTNEEKHSWSKEDRTLLCLILKKLGFKYKTCNSISELTELRKNHYVIMQKAAESMTIIYGKEFTMNQIEFQIYKPHMHRQLLEGVVLKPAVYEMMKCMIETDLLDEEGFFNMNYGYYNLIEKKKNEDKLIKEAQKIINERKVMKI